jgi:hypothetical protein
VRIRGERDVAQALAKLVTGEERKEQIAEVHDVERPDDSDSRHASDTTGSIGIR